MKDCHYVKSCPRQGAVCLTGRRMRPSDREGQRSSAHGFIGLAILHSQELPQASSDLGVQSDQGFRAIVSVIRHEMGYVYDLP